MSGDRQGVEVRHGEVYQHEIYGEVEVIEILDPIAAIGPDGPERNYFIKFSLDPGAPALPEHKILREQYERFAERASEQEDSHAE